MSLNVIGPKTKVLILGLGSYPKGSGVSAAIYALRKGAQVRITDLKTAEELKGNVAKLKRFTNATFFLGKHRLQDIRWADIIIRNPGVRRTSPELRLAARLGKRVESDISLFLAECPCPVIGVTGTRGKSTTTTLVAGMLKASGKRVWMGGNILISPLTFLSRIKKNDLAVLELSSWLLETTGARSLSPRYAVVTNLMRDHLNTYTDMDEYAEAKAQIFRHQDHTGIVVLNTDDHYGRLWQKEAPGRVLSFGTGTKQTGWLTKRSLEWNDPLTGRIERIVFRNKMKLLGEHNAWNMLAAALVARAAGASLAAIRSVAMSFTGLENRLETLAIKRGIRFVNDTTASTPDAVIAALRALEPLARRILLIAGGADKDLEFGELAREMKKYQLSVFLLPGTAYGKFSLALKRARISFQDARDLPEAFGRALGQAKKHDIVLLSPGCASFGLFRNEFERGEQFRKLVKIALRRSSVTK